MKVGRLLLYRFHVTLNSRQAPPAVVQTSFVYDETSLHINIQPDHLLTDRFHVITQHPLILTRMLITPQISTQLQGLISQIIGSNGMRTFECVFK